MPALAALLPAVTPILDRLISLIPDPAAAAKAKAEALQSVLEAGTRIDEAQLEVNKAEAANGSLFVAGWRPAVGWVCAAACAWNWIGLPIGMFFAAAFHQHLEIRPLDLSEMFPVLMGMLGMAGMRTYEKLQGISREALSVGK
jgi:hypothetical protein